MPEQICFVIAPIGEAGSEVRKRSDLILKHLVAPAASECNYKALRADQISEPGMITSQIIQHIVDDPLVIADLTGRNPNVFYELAIRHAIRKPLVQIIQKGEQIPFDVAGTRTVHVDHHDLDSVADAKREVVSQISSLEADSSKLETPISVSLDLQSLRQSDNPEQRSLADVLSALTELRSSISGLEKRMDVLTISGNQQLAEKRLRNYLFSGPSHTGDKHLAFDELRQFLSDDNYATRLALDKSVIDAIRKSIDNPTMENLDRLAKNQSEESTGSRISE